MELTQIANPGVMLSQVWPQSREKEGETLRALEVVLKLGFFKALQTVEIPFARERKEFASVLHNSGIPLTYCLARIINENRLNLSDIDSVNRLRSCDMVVECIEQACEAGAGSITLISGPAPMDERGRIAALDLLAESLCRICDEASSNRLKVIIEPLDYFAHKKNTLGATREAVEVCRKVKAFGRELFLCIDTAHAFLNGEDPAGAVKLAADYAPEFHLCNCVTDSMHKLYGDFHIPFGKPGILGVREIAEIMGELLDFGYFSETKKPGIFCEVLKQPGEDSETLMKYCKDSMESAWSLCSKMKGE